MNLNSRLVIKYKMERHILILMSIKAMAKYYLMNIKKYSKFSIMMIKILKIKTNLKIIRKIYVYALIFCFQALNPLNYMQLIKDF